MRLKDKTLLAISLATSTTGLIALLAISLTSGIDDPSSVLLEDEQTRTTIQATVTYADTRGNLTLLALQGSCTIEAVAYEPLAVKEGMRIQATGTIDQYRGRRQLVLESVKTQP